MTLGLGHPEVDHRDSLLIAVVPDSAYPDVVWKADIFTSAISTFVVIFSFCLHNYAGPEAFKLYYPKS